MSSQWSRKLAALKRDGCLYPASCHQSGNSPSVCLCGFLKTTGVDINQEDEDRVQHLTTLAGTTLPGNSFYNRFIKGDDPPEDFKVFEWNDKDKDW